MISKARLKDLAGYRQQDRCEAEGVFVVEGVKMADEALRSGFSIRTVCATAQWLRNHALPGDIEGIEVGQGELERLSGMRNPNEVWLLAERRQEAQISSACDGLILVLDHLQDPGNMGTIIRTADWFGLRRIVCSRDTVSCYNPKVVQASMGGIFRTTIAYQDLADWLAGYRHPIYGALLDGDDIFKRDLQTPAALVIGNESRGISPEIQQLLTHRIAIPNRGGTAESLNAAVATAICCALFTR